MEFFMKLPRNKKEFALFLAIISLISVNIIAPLITCFEVGFSLQTWGNAMRAVPLIWPCVIALVLLTYKPAEWLTGKITAKGDSFRVVMIVNALCTVLMMSVFLTVLGTWIGCRSVTMEPIRHFFFKWPRNFAVAFGVELLIAQPIARLVLYKLHQSADRRGQTNAGAREKTAA